VLTTQPFLPLAGACAVVACRPTYFFRLNALMPWGKGPEQEAEEEEEETAKSLD
jgi:hypothetical protein